MSVLFLTVLIITKVFNQFNQYRQTCYSIMNYPTKIKIWYSIETRFDFNYMDLDILQGDARIGDFANQTKTEIYLEKVDEDCKDYLSIGKLRTDYATRSNITLIFKVWKMDVIIAVFQFMLEENHVLTDIPIFSNDGLLGTIIKTTTEPTKYISIIRPEFETIIARSERDPNFSVTPWYYGTGTLMVLGVKILTAELYSFFKIELSKKVNDEYVLVDTVSIPIMISVIDEPYHRKFNYAYKIFDEWYMIKYIFHINKSLRAALTVKQIGNSRDDVISEKDNWTIVDFGMDRSLSDKKTLPLFAAPIEQKSCRINLADGQFRKHVLLEGRDIIISRYFEKSSEYQGFLFAKEMEKDQIDSCNGKRNIPKY